MNNIRRITVLMFACVVLSLGPAGCKSGDKARHDEHPKAEQPKGEHPKGDHPKH